MKGFLKGFKKIWLTWAALGLFIIFFAFLALSEFQRWFALQKELKEREFEIQKINENTEQLSQEIEEVSDPRFLEKEARAKLNLKAEGEKVFVVVGLESIQKEENFDEIFEHSVETQRGIWLNIRNWYRYFFQN
jgi:cell division protein FtsB